MVVSGVFGIKVPDMPDRRKKNGYGIVIYRGLNEMVRYG